MGSKFLLLAILTKLFVGHIILRQMVNKSASFNIRHGNADMTSLDGAEQNITDDEIDKALDMARKPAKTGTPG